MATIPVSLTTTDEQDRALAWRLKNANMDREVTGAKPHADVAELLTTVLCALCDTYLTDHQTAQGTRIRDALLTATPDECAMIAEILKVTWP